jgi:hypothetical protein
VSCLREVLTFLQSHEPAFLVQRIEHASYASDIRTREFLARQDDCAIFLRAGFDQHEQELVPLGEELVVVRAYLEIESLRLGRPIEGRRGHRTGIVGRLTPFLASTAGGERGATRTAILAGDGLPPPRCTSGRGVVEHEHQR